MDLLRSIFAQVGINKTFYVQFALVVVAYYFLSKFMFRPLLTILVARKHKTTGLLHMADEALAETDRIIDDFSSQWERYEREAEEIREKASERSAIEAKEIMNEAGSRAHALVEQKRKAIREQITEISKVLERDVPSISSSISEKLLGGGSK